MAKRIYLESAPALHGITTAGHMYLVFRESSPKSDGTFNNLRRNDDQVIRGGPGSDTSLPLEVKVQLLRTSGDAYGATDTPSSRHSVDITDLIMANAPSGATVAQAWAEMQGFARAINGNYAYDAPVAINYSDGIANSNATILSVLNDVGVDVGTIKAPGSASLYVDAFRFSGHPGADSDTPTLLGNSQNVVIDAMEGVSRGLYFQGRDGVADYMYSTRFADTHSGYQDRDHAHLSDAVDYSRSSEGVELRSSTGRIMAGSGGDAEGDFLIGIEWVVGSAHGDTIVFVDQELPEVHSANRIEGLGGDDSLYGGVGNDTILGGSNNDTIDGGSGVDDLFGGVGNDTIYFDRADRTVSGGGGDDELHLTNQYASHGNVFASGGAGYDTLHLSEGAILGMVFHNGAAMLDLASGYVTGVEEIRTGSGADATTETIDELITQMSLGQGVRFGGMQGMQPNSEWSVVTSATVRENGGEDSHLLFKGKIADWIPDNAEVSAWAGGFITDKGQNIDVSIQVDGDVVSVFTNNVIDAEAFRVITGGVTMTWKEEWFGREYLQERTHSTMTFVLNERDTVPTDIIGSDVRIGNGYSFQNAAHFKVDKFDAEAPVEFWLSNDGGGVLRLEGNGDLFSNGFVDFGGRSHIDFTVAASDGFTTIYEDFKLINMSMQQPDSLIV